MYDQKAVKKWRSSPNGRAYYKKYMVEYHYGVTWEFVVDMYAKQRGACALCGRSLPPLVGHATSRNVCLDHNHETKDVRGLIHRRCNRLLGYVENLPISVAAFVAYTQSSVGVKVHPREKPRVSSIH